MVPTSLRVQFLKAKEAAEAANHANGEFLANLSYEVRTALSNVIGMTDSVLTTELKPEQRRDLSIVNDSANSLLEIVDDILDFFKIAERQQP